MDYCPTAILSVKEKLANLVDLKISFLLIEQEHNCGIDSPRSSKLDLSTAQVWRQLMLKRDKTPKFTAAVNENVVNRF